MVIGNWQRFAWKKPKKNSAHIVSIRSQGDSALVVSISSQGDSPVFSFDDSDWVIESDCAGGATLDPRRSASSSRFPAVEKVWARTGAQAASQRQQGGVDLSFGLNSIRGSKKWFNIETEGMWVLQKQIWKIQQGGLRKHQVNTEGIRQERRRRVKFQRKIVWLGGGDIMLIPKTLFQTCLLFGTPLAWVPPGKTLSPSHPN